MSLVGGEERSPAVNVLIVDDHPLFRAGLRAALESTPDIRVVAEPSTAGAVADAVARHRPDVVVMVLTLPDGSGIEATRRLTAAGPAAPVLMLTMSDDDGSLLPALQA